MAQALYSKYRPKTFKDVVGQKQTLQTLKNAITGDKVSHAYLFCGPRGTGKTTMARLLAKACMCENAVNPTLPVVDFCGTCQNCQDIAAGQHPDVYELDAASRTGVENVREEIISRVGFAATKGNKKIYIIDEVHMLSTAAFNALLKTLEEPPEHVIFILCTTDPQKVPETIISRCQRFDFESISADDIVERLKYVCEKESVTAQEPALKIIADKAHGAMRNALTQLEQLISYSNGQITEDQVRESLVGQDSYDYMSLVQALGQKNLPAIFEWVQAACDKGADFIKITEKLTSIIRDLYINSAGANASIENADICQKCAGLFTTEKLHHMLIILNELQSDLRMSSNLRLSFEIAMAKIANPKSDFTLEALADRISQLETGAPKAPLNNTANNTFAAVSPEPASTVKEQKTNVSIPGVSVNPVPSINAQEIKNQKLNDQTTNKQAPINNQKEKEPVKVNDDINNQADKSQNKQVDISAKNQDNKESDNKSDEEKPNDKQKEVQELNNQNNNDESINKDENKNPGKPFHPPIKPAVGVVAPGPFTETKIESEIDKDKKSKKAKNNDKNIDDSVVSSKDIPEQKPAPDFKIPERPKPMNFGKERSKLRQQANLEEPPALNKDSDQEEFDIQKLWRKAFSSIRKKYPAFGATLLTADVKYDKIKNLLILTFPTSASFSVGVLKKPDSMKKIQTEIKKAINPDIIFEIVIDSDTSDAFSPQFSNNFRSIDTNVKPGPAGISESSLPEITPRDTSTKSSKKITESFDAIGFDEAMPVPAPADLPDPFESKSASVNQTSNIGSTASSNSANKTANPQNTQPNAGNIPPIPPVPGFLNVDSGQSVTNPAQSGMQPPVPSPAQSGMQPPVANPAQSGMQPPVSSTFQNPAQSGMQPPVSMPAQSGMQPPVQNPAQAGMQQPVQSNPGSSFNSAFADPSDPFSQSNPANAGSSQSELAKLLGENGAYNITEE